MRRIATAILILLTLTQNAQSDSTKHSHISFSLGASAAPYGGFSKDNVDNHSSGSYGGFFSYRLLNRKGFSFALSLSQKTGTTVYSSYGHFGGTFGENKLTYCYGFINPAYFISYSEKRRFNLGVGFYAGLLLFSNPKNIPNSGTGGLSLEMNYKLAQFKKSSLQLGLLSQVGSKDLMSPFSFNLFLSYLIRE